MTTVQLNLYIFTYNNNNKDFDVISSKHDKLVVPSVAFTSNNLTLRQQLDSLFENISIEYKPVYRLLNNIYIDSIFHCVYFCVIPNYLSIKDTVFKIPVQKYGIHSPNIQQIMQSIR